MIQHLEIALRMLARRPGLTAGRALTVTIVVAAVSAVFTVANATFLRPLPFPHSDRLLRLFMLPPGQTAFKDANPFKPIEFERFRERVRSLEQIEGIWAADRAVTGDGEPEAVPAARVSAGFFGMFGGEAEVGRVFTEQEVTADEKVVVLAHGLWMRRFGGDRTAVGRTMLLDGEPHLIVGVMRRGFEPAFVPSALWTPLTTRNAMGRTLLNSVVTYGRLREGRTAAQSTGELATVLADLTKEMPAILTGWTVNVKDMRDALYGTQGPAVLMLLAAVAALALIAIANLANLTLADVMFRRGDFAVRAALGASRRNLAAGEMMPALILAAAGWAAGVGAAAWLVPAMLSLDPSGSMAAAQAPVDWRVALCGFGVALVVMLAAVAAPVLRVAGPRLASDVTAGTRRAIGGRTARRTRIALVTAQTALALVLLSSGAHIVTALYRTARVNPGFDPANVVTGQLRLSANLFPTERDRAQFVDRIIERLQATPGIVSAGTTLNSFTVNGSFVTLVRVEDRPAADGQGYTVQFRRISPGYFDAMRIPLLRGRAFDTHDRVDAAPVAIVSRGFARRFWGDADPVGRRIKRGASAQAWSTIVGVVEDVRDVGLNVEAGDTVYTPYYQGSNPAAPVGLVVRTQGDPRGRIDAITRAIREVDPTQPLANVVTLESFLAASLGAQRFRAMLIAVCGAIGLLLATIGTYGVTARSVVERTREVGIRLALGGNPLAVWWAVAWGSVQAVIAGALAGVAASALAGAGLAALLPDLQGAAWGSAAGCAIGLALVGIAAAAIAARGAISVDPLTALKEP